MRNDSIRGDLSELGYNQEEAYFYRLNRELIEKLHPPQEEAEDEPHRPSPHLPSRKDEGIFGERIEANWA